MKNTTKPKIETIKENIGEKEYKKLMAAVRGNESIRDYKKLNILRTFCILYYGGLRVNEIRDIKYKNIYELLENGATIILSAKTKIERKLFLTDDFRKDLIKLFSIIENEDNSIIFNDRKKESKHSNIAFINLINNCIKEILGDRFSSHSFRRGLITEMGSKGVNTKIISKFIGHKNVSTTMRYINPTDDDIRNALIR